MDGKDRIIAELRELNANLTAQLERQVARIAALELALAKAKKDSSTSSNPPSSDIVTPKPKQKAHLIRDIRFLEKHPDKKTSGLLLRSSEGPTRHVWACAADTSPHNGDAQEQIIDATLRSRPMRICAYCTP
jgi:hypothetical protein